jgi:plastin-1
MQHYFLNALKTLRFGGKEVKEDDIVKWLNDKIASSPAAATPTTPQRSRITSFKDPTLSTGLAFIDLLQALRPGCVAKDLVQKGDTREQCLANAKYVVSVARKIGASTFLVPEDIAEVNSKMILAFVGSLMSLKDVK